MSGPEQHLTSESNVDSDRGSVQEGSVGSGNSSSDEHSLSVDFHCGQVSLLGQYKLRLDQGFSNTGHGEAGQHAQREMLNDLWLSVVVADNPIAPHIRAVKQAIKSGDDAAFEDAYGAASNACSENGSGIVMGFLPGEGG